VDGVGKVGLWGIRGGGLTAKYAKSAKKNGMFIIREIPGLLALMSWRMATDFTVFL
jgi:hypothetical protein